jgi:pimeloyl-ACP methyl ester carboxylesterase
LHLKNKVNSFLYHLTSSHSESVMTRERVRLGGIGGRDEVAVRVAGDGAPLLLVHGIPGSAGSWDAVIPGLVEAGYRVLVPDLLGFGDSTRPRSVEGLWLDSQAHALAAVLEALTEGPALIVGHDYGAPVSVTLARLQPARVSGLVLSSGNLFTDTPIPLALRSLRLPFLGPLAARAALSAPSLRLMLRLGSGRPHPTMDPAVYLGDRRQQEAIRTIFTTALRELELRYAEVEEALSKLGKPVVVLWGDRDPFLPIEEGRRAAAAIPGAELRIAEGAGHFLPAERPLLFHEAVAQLASRDVMTGERGSEAGLEPSRPPA